MLIEGGGIQYFILMPSILLSMVFQNVNVFDSIADKKKKKTMPTPKADVQFLTRPSVWKASLFVRKTAE